MKKRIIHNLISLLSLILLFGAVSQFGSVKSNSYRIIEQKVQVKIIKIFKTLRHEKINM